MPVKTNTTIAHFHALAAVGSAQLSSLILYSLVQFILVTRLSPVDYGLFVSANILAQFCGQLATSGIDGKIMSNTTLSKSLDYNLILKAIFEYIPFAIVISTIFVFSLVFPGSPLNYLKSNNITAIFIVLTAFLQPLQSILFVLAERNKNVFISNIILSGPWLLRSFLLLCSPFFINLFHQFSITIEYVMCSFLLSSVTSIFYAFKQLAVNQSLVNQYFLQYTQNFYQSPIRIFQLMWQNYTFFLTSIFIMAPISIAPTILNNSPAGPSSLPAFSFSYVLFGIFQSVGSQYLMRNYSYRLLKYSQFLSLQKLFFKIFYFAKGVICFYFFSGFLIVIAFLLLVHNRLIPYSYHESLSLLVILMLGLFPSSLVTLWHVVFNKIYYKNIHLASRMLACIAIMPIMLIASNAFNAYGLCLTLSLYPLVVLLSYAFCVLASNNTITNRSV